MNLFDKIAWYLRNRGVRGLIVRIVAGRNADIAAQVSEYSATLVKGEVSSIVSAHRLVANRYLNTQPLPVYLAPGPMARINLVTDSINTGSLFGGVGTSIILAAMLADQCGAKLRVVTRTEPPDENGFYQVLQCNGVSYRSNVEFAHIEVGDKNARLDICEGDRFLTTSWWTTASVLGSILPHKVDYLLQEDERMFYPFGDEWLRCSELLSRRDIRFVINTELLYQHLIQNGLGHLKGRSVWFEPAFPEKVFGKRGQDGRYTQKRKLFFYARPNNLRNLFYRGIEVLDRVVREGLLDPEKWDVIFVGKDIPKLKLGGVLEPEIIPTMNWQAYGKLISSIDVGFCLMCTPHPSYPPLDLAAAGAVVVTNRFGLKRDLHKYSDNIQCVDLDVESLVKGLLWAVERSHSRGERAESGVNHLSKTWQASLTETVNFLANV